MEKVMDLDRRQWYVRWFFWSLNVWEEFTDGNADPWRYDLRTNLCHFLRVMLIWCPLALLLNAVVYASGIAVLTALPIYFWGGTGYTYVILAIALVVGVIFALKALFRRLGEHRRMNPPAPKPQKRPKVATPAPTGPSFWQVLKEYIVAAKQKVCPVITFHYSEEGDPS